jgi:phosphonopyruvate decarboxylase
VDGAGTVIDCCQFVAALAKHGWATASGVPCSTFAGPIRHLDEAGAYETSANEGLALSSSVGAALAGRRQAVLLQNSGLGNLLNPLVSLAIPYRVPVLALMSLRGWPDPAQDEPQHALMGKHSAAILDQLEVWTETVDAGGDWRGAIARATEVIDNGHSAFLLVPLQSIGQHPRASVIVEASTLPTSGQVAAAVAEWARPESFVVSTTGYLSRFLYAAGDRERNFYMQGSMGHAASIALGFARAEPDTEVIALDGDGAVLMHTGVLSTIGAQAPRNLTHVVVDNGSYASTGGQLTTSACTDFAELALASGYRTAITVEHTESLKTALELNRCQPGPHMVAVRSRAINYVAPPRPSADLSLVDVARRVSAAGTLFP